METPTCRFCFEAETRLNKLLTPCKCQGSIQFIHIKCLLKWQSVAPIEYIHKCQLCLSYYRNGTFIFETIPNERGYIYNFLICPYLTTFTSKYLVFLFSEILLQNQFQRFQVIGLFQMFLHILYFLFFIQTAQVNNIRLYLKHYFRPHRFLTYTSHFLAILYSSETENIIALYLLDVFLPCYWHYHLRSLEEINHEME
jgi:hypothetical protein